MSKKSAFGCPLCGKMSMKVVRTTLVGKTRRIRFYACQADGCVGAMDTEERVLQRVCADVRQKAGQTPESPW